MPRRRSVCCLCDIDLGMECSGRPSAEGCRSPSSSCPAAARPTLSGTDLRDMHQSFLGSPALLIKRSRLLWTGFVLASVCVGRVGLAGGTLCFLNGSLLERGTGKQESFHKYHIVVALSSHDGRLSSKDASAQRGRHLNR